MVKYLKRKPAFDKQNKPPSLKKQKEQLKKELDKVFKDFKGKMPEVEIKPYLPLPRNNRYSGWLQKERALNNRMNGKMAGIVAPKSNDLVKLQKLGLIKF